MSEDTTSAHLAAEFSVVVNKDDQAEVYVGHVPALNLYSQGRTEHEALRAIEHAVRLYLTVASGRGYLDRILARSALRPSDAPPVVLDIVDVAATGELSTV